MGDSGEDGFSPFHFIQISDPHIIPQRTDVNQRLLDTITEINRLKPAFVIVTGDMIDASSDWHVRTFKAINSYMKTRSFLMPGNHELGNDIPPQQIADPYIRDLIINRDMAVPRYVRSGGADEAEDPPLTIEEAEARRWRYRNIIDEGKISYYESRFGRTYFSFKHNNCRFIALNPYLFLTGMDKEKEQWRFLEENLNLAVEEGNTHVILLLHKPLFIKNPYEQQRFTVDGIYWIVPSPARDTLLEYIRRYHIRTVITGHLHRYLHIRHEWPEGFYTDFITCGAIGEGYGYIIYKVEKNRITHTCVKYESYASEKHPRSPEEKTSHNIQLKPLRSTATEKTAHKRATTPHNIEKNRRPIWKEGYIELRSPEREGLYTFEFKLPRGEVKVQLDLTTRSKVNLSVNNTEMMSIPPIPKISPFIYPEINPATGKARYIIDEPTISIILPQHLLKDGLNTLTIHIKGEEATSCKIRLTGITST